MDAKFKIILTGAWKKFWKFTWHDKIQWRHG